MLEQLFGSKARVLILRLFLNNPEKFFYVREISRNLSLHLNSVRRELNNLEEIGILASLTKADLEKEIEKELKDNKKYYKLNSSFVFVEELRSLLIKAQLIMEQSLADKVKKLGSVNLFLLSGVFVGRNDAPTDLLIVGTVDRQKLLKLIKGFEKELGRQINYTIMTKQDFIYRRGLTDKFLYDLMEQKNLLLVDDLKV